MKYLLALSIFIVGLYEASALESPMKQVRTYMPFSFPLDPVRITTLADMDLSFALGSTLVQWDQEKQVSAAVAESWEPIAPQTIRFKIRKNLKWSDGSLVTAADVKRSFERGFKAHPADLRSLINLVKEITCPSSSEIDFKLAMPIPEIGLLGKLAEPNYSILKVTNGTDINLGVSTTSLEALLKEIVRDPTGIFWG
jgi:ABC-type transport system substrate-binding protein